MRATSEAASPRADRTPSGGRRRPASAAACGARASGSSFDAVEDCQDACRRGEQPVGVASAVERPRAVGQQLLDEQDASRRRGLRHVEKTGGEGEQLRPAGPHRRSRDRGSCGQQSATRSSSFSSWPITPSVARRCSTTSCIASSSRPDPPPLPERPMRAERRRQRPWAAAVAKRILQRPYRTPQRRPTITPADNTPCVDIDFSFGPTLIPRGLFLVSATYAHPAAPPLRHRAVLVSGCDFRSRLGTPAPLLLGERDTDALSQRTASRWSRGPPGAARFESCRALSDGSRGGNRPCAAHGCRPERTSSF